MRTKDKSKRTECLKRIYTKAIEKNLIFGAIIFILGVCVFFDNWNEEYWHPFLEKIFNRKEADYANLLTLMLAVWAAALSIVVIGIGKMEEMRNGIKLIYIVREKEHFANLIRLLKLFVFQLFLIMTACLHSWEITMTILGVLQIGILLFVFMVLYFETSEESIKEGIVDAAVKHISKENEKGIVNDLMIRVIKATDYQKDTECDYLLEIYECIIAKVKKDNYRLLDKYMEISMEYLLELSIEKDRLKMFVLNLLKKVKKNKGNKEKKEEENIAKGIVTFLMKNINNPHVPDIRSVINCDFPLRKEMICWGIAYNVYFCSFEGQDYRMKIAEDLRKELEVYPDLEDRKRILRYWKEIDGENLIYEGKNNSLIRLLELINQVG